MAKNSDPVSLPPVGETEDQIAHFVERVKELAALGEITVPQCKAFRELASEARQNLKQKHEKTREDRLEQLVHQLEASLHQYEQYEIDCRHHRKEPALGIWTERQLRAWHEFSNTKPESDDDESKSPSDALGAFLYAVNNKSSAA